MEWGFDSALHSELKVGIGSGGEIGIEIRVGTEILKLNCRLESELFSGLQVVIGIGGQIGIVSVVGVGF